MNAADILSTLEQSCIVPVVTIDDARRAEVLAGVLLDAGLATAEVALRTPNAIRAIEAMATVDGFTVGTGTVLKPADIQAAAGAGASYLVSPGYDEQLIECAGEIGMAFIPGVATASEVQHATAAGLTHLKLFPAGPLGGLSLIEAFKGPFPESRFMPSGGVSLANLSEYLASEAVFAVSGSWMVPGPAIAARDWATISRLTSDAVAASRIVG